MWKKILGLVFLFMVHSSWFIAPLALAQEENITFTTYYPSPMGSYRELRSQRMAIGNTYYNRANVCWDPPCGSGIDISDSASRDIDLIVEGNVGIGTLNPKHILHVVKNAPYPDWSSVVFTNTGGCFSGLELRSTTSTYSTAYLDFAVNSTDDAGGGTPDGTARIWNDVWEGGNKLYFGLNYPDTTRPDQAKVTIQADGNVGIGTTAPSTSLEVNGDIKIVTASGALNRFFRAEEVGVAGNKAGIAFGGNAVKGAIYGSSGTSGIKIVGANSPVDIGTTSGTDATDISAFTSRLFINSNGNVGIGTTAPPGEKLEVNGNVKAVAFLYSSDYGLKTNIMPLSNQLEKVLTLQGVFFEWKENNEKSLGLIAQDVEKVFPELVFTDKNTGLKSLEYGKLVAPLIEAIKEQQEQIEELKAKVEKLENNQN